MVGQAVIELHCKSYYQGSWQMQCGVRSGDTPIGHLSVGDVRVDSIGTIRPNVIGIIPILV